MAAKYGGLIKWIWNRVNHFDYDAYWKMREYVCKSGGGMLAYYFLYKIKKVDSYHNASMGTHLKFRSAEFKTRPILPHGLNGIVISNEVTMGSNCTIYHQVTIGGGVGGAPTIGDNVMFGAGAKVIGRIHIGNNVKIGANCIVTSDIPDNATVVMEKPRIIIK